MHVLQARSLLPLSLVLFPSPAAAQGPGSYLNFESPQLDPIVVTDTGVRPWLLACNTPDNSVEVYSLLASATAPTFVVRVPTGLEPVTIAVKPTLLPDNVRRCYVAGWLSDSITIFDLASSGAVTLVRTERVGDEPVGIAFRPGEPEDLIVTFSAQGAWGWFDSTTLQAKATGYERLELLANVGAKALEDPRAVAFSPATAQSPNLAGKMFVLNFRGGSDPSQFDYDLWSGPVFSLTTRPDTAGLPDLVAADGLDALGSTNFNMAFAPNGDLYVVSQHARNKELVDFVTTEGGSDMQGLVTNSTGFVTSQLVRVRGAGTATPVIERIDLNATNPSQHQLAQHAVPITQPTDVAVKGSGADGATRVFVTGFNSDTIGMIEPTGTGTWNVTRIDVRHPTAPFPSSTFTGIMRGPRGLAMNAAQSHVYVLNRLENSVTVLNANFTAPPATAVLNTFSLQQHPVPARITDGRKILYSSRLSGGNNVSCASCHIDGNSDFLAWNLSDGEHVPSSPNDTNVNKGGDPLGFLGPNTIQEDDNPALTVENVKGPLQTQSLRGLVNFEVANPSNQDRYFSNAPYHWRGDRGVFKDFNEAFVNLMALGAASSDPVMGITDDAMSAFRDFVSTIHYPPNPDQPITRVYSGSMTSPSNGPLDPLEDTQAGWGALRGLKNMHIESSDGGDNGESMGPNPTAKRGCITCHSLPEGSNNRFTDRFAYANTLLDAQRLETAALRRLDLKERELWRKGPTGDFVPTKVGNDNVVTGEFGLVHTGDTTLTGLIGRPPSDFRADSIAGFIEGFPDVVSESDYVTIMREFDTGVAPVIGQVVTVNSGNSTTVGAALDVLEGEARKGNAGLAVVARIGSVRYGFWYDVRNFATTPYTQEGSGSPLGPYNRADLLLNATGTNVLVFQSVPLGSARRVARPLGGLPPPLGGSPPSNLVLKGCTPSTAYKDVPLLTVNWFDTFTFGATTPGNVGIGFDSRIDLNIGNNKTLVWFQASLIYHAATATPAGFGLTDFQHEPSRRFVVTGTGIQEGAVLRIYLPNASDYGTSAPSSTPNATTHPNPIEVPIFATETSSGGIEWQSAVEIEPYHLFAMMNGGPASSAVQEAREMPDRLDTLSPPLIPDASGRTDFFEPLKRNWYYVEVINDPANPSTTTASGGWQRMTIQ